MKDIEKKNMKYVREEEAGIWNWNQYGGHLDALFRTLRDMFDISEGKDLPPGIALLTIFDQLPELSKGINFAGLDDVRTFIEGKKEWLKEKEGTLSNMRKENSEKAKSEALKEISEKLKSIIVKIEKIIEPEALMEIERILNVPIVTGAIGTGGSNVSEEEREREERERIIGEIEGIFRMFPSESPLKGKLLRVISFGEFNKKKLYDRIQGESTLNPEGTDEKFKEALRELRDALKEPRVGILPSSIKEQVVQKPPVEIPPSPIKGRVVHGAEGKWLKGAVEKIRIFFGGNSEEEKKIIEDERLRKQEGKIIDDAPGKTKNFSLNLKLNIKNIRDTWNELKKIIFSVFTPKQLPVDKVLTNTKVVADKTSRMPEQNKMEKKNDSAPDDKKRGVITPNVVAEKKKSQMLEQYDKVKNLGNDICAIYDKKRGMIPDGVKKSLLQNIKEFNTESNKLLGDGISTVPNVFSVKQIDKYIALCHTISEIRGKISPSLSKGESLKEVEEKQNKMK